MTKVEHGFQRFISTHEDLVAEYEEMEYTDPIEFCKDEILFLYKNCTKSNKNIELSDFLETGIRNAIKYKTNIIDSLGVCIPTMCSQSESNITQQYFKEINKIYTKNNNNFDIEYCPENRNKLIEMNLKTVISIAKKYRGLGLSLNELISAGNLGLVTAYDKFDPSRSTLKDNAIEALNKLPDKIHYQELRDAMADCIDYGNVKQKFNNRFAKDKTYTKEEVAKWINGNIYNAKFNSIAVMWIRAFILIEIDNNSRIVKKPKTEIYKDKDKYGAYKKEITLDIDAPVSDDSDTAIVDVFTVEDDTHSDMEVAEAYETYKGGLMLLLDGVKKRDKNIFLKKFGIGLPRPMLPKEIADQEGLSIARISQIFRTVIDQMQKNQVKYNIDPTELFDTVKKIY